MRHFISRVLLIPTTACAFWPSAAAGQVGTPERLSQPRAGTARAAITRRLSVDEAVRLALEQNLGIQAERLNPQIRDLTIAEARAAWAPTIGSRGTICG